MKLLGIVGSPKKNGNAFQFMQKAFEPVANGEWETEIIQLAGKKVADCIHCNKCLKSRDPEKICYLKDDAEEILKKLGEADAVVICSPAYYGRMTGRLAALLDRTRPFLFSRPHRGKMTDKPGAALSVAWGRNSGSETTLLSILYSYLVLEMLPVSHHHSGALFGAAGISNPLLVGAQTDDKQAVKSDVAGILTAQAVVKRTMDLATRLGK